MTQAEIDLATERVRLYGQREPIETFNGEIVAGVLEYHGCLGAKTQPRLSPIKAPDDLVEYVCRRNVPRNLSPVDRGCIAVLAREQWQKLAHERKRLGGKLRGARPRSFEGERWFEHAARILGTPPRTVRTLARIYNKHPDIFEAVRARKIIMLRDAIDLGKLPDKSDRKEALKRFVRTQSISGQGPKVPIAKHVWDLRREHTKAALLTTTPKRSALWELHEGDFRDAKLAPKSFDALVADIPYGDVTLARDLGKLAAHVLRPGGVMAVINGNTGSNLPVLSAISESMTFVTTGAVHLKNTHAQHRTQGRLQRLKVNGQVKHCDVEPVFYFCRGPRLGRTIERLHYESEAMEKKLHSWQKSTQGMTEILRAIVDPGARVLDPVCGSGTTGEAALRLGCTFTGIDIDSEAVQVSRARLTKVEGSLRNRMAKAV